LGLLVAASEAAAATRLEIAIRDHKFVPAQLTAPAGEVVELVVTNEGPGSEEFESKALRVERIIAQGKTVTLRVGPLKPGTYDLFGEFHMDTCLGTLTVP
jgi:plastocyanin